jgi:hypothetical protein
MRAAGENLGYGHWPINASDEFTKKLINDMICHSGKVDHN